MKYWRGAKQPEVVGAHDRHGGVMCVYPNVLGVDEAGGP